MSIPDFQNIMRPLLDLAADGKEHSIGEVTDRLAERFRLSEEERADRLEFGSFASCVI